MNKYILLWKFIMQKSNVINKCTVIYYTAYFFYILFPEIESLLIILLLLRQLSQSQQFLIYLSNKYNHVDYKYKQFIKYFLIY